MSIISMLFCSTLFPLLSHPCSTPCAEKPGAIELVNGERVGGLLEREEDSHYVLRRGKRIERFPREEVRRFIPLAELDTRLDALAASPHTASPFGRAQLGLEAVELGHFERAVDILADLQQQKLEPASLGRLEDALARETLARLDERGVADMARAYLLELPARSKDPRDLVGLALAPRVVHLLLELGDLELGDHDESLSSGEGEATRDDKQALRPVEAVVRKFASGSFDDARRRAARLALLERSDAARRFVYRLTIANPAGPTRDAVAADLREAGQASPATRYLAQWLGKPNRGLEVRAVEALGTIASPDAIPVLEGLRASIPARYKADSSGSGATRANVSFTTQQAYVADYEVEVATAAAIAKPVIRTATSGVVLDATVAGMWATRYYSDLRGAIDTSLRKLRSLKTR